MRSLLPLIGLYTLATLSPLYGGDKGGAAKRGLEIKPLYNGIEAAYNVNGQFQPRVIFVNSARFRGAEIKFGGPVDFRMKQGEKSSFATRQVVSAGRADGKLSAITVLKISNGMGGFNFSPYYGLRYSNDWSYTDLAFSSVGTDFTFNADIKLGRSLLNPFASVRIPHNGSIGKKELSGYFESYFHFPIWKKTSGFLRYETDFRRNNFVAGISAKL